MRVELKEAFQAREETLQPFRVHLKVLLQLPGVHVQHYLQRSHVVHLCLHQLCAGTYSYCVYLLLRVHLSAVDWLTVTLLSCPNIQFFNFFVKYFEKSSLFL